MSTKLPIISLATEVKGHSAIEGENGVYFVPEQITLTQYPGDRLTNGPFVSIRGTRVLKSGKIGVQRHYVSVHLSGRRLYNEIDMDTLRHRSPELAAEVERQVTMIEGLS